mmetsp:Transcript_58580/g.104492  ORF Transcript_58580/g.104492 Transcript_58580/m.104492 type:complete len:365 (-) Transcript_58580:864-1958(-)
MTATVLVMQDALDSIQSFAAFQKRILDKAARVNPSFLHGTLVASSSSAQLKKAESLRRRLEDEQREKEQQERERQEHERERQQKEKERLQREKERRAQEEEKERLQKDKERQQKEKERMRREREAQERLEQEKIERVRLEQKRREQERQDKERKEKERKEREARSIQEQEEKENNLKRQNDEADRRHSKKQKAVEGFPATLSSPKKEPHPTALSKPETPRSPYAKTMPLGNKTNLQPASSPKSKGALAVQGNQNQGPPTMALFPQHTNKAPAAQPAPPQTAAADTKKNNPPSWARSQAIHEALQQQTIDPDEIFAPLSGVDLEAVFGPAFLKHKRPRTSSANWEADRYTKEEEMVYKRELGYIK